MRAAFKDKPQEASIDDLAVSKDILARAGLDERDVTRACLFLIRHGGFCDAQVLADVLPKLAEGQAAKPPREDAGD